MVQPSVSLDVQSIMEIEDELDSINQKETRNYNHQFQEHRDRLTTEVGDEDDIKYSFDGHPNNNNNNNNKIDKMIIERIIKKYLKQKNERKSKIRNPSKQKIKKIISDYLENKKARLTVNREKLDHEALDRVIADYLRTNKKRKDGKESHPEDTKATTEVFGNEKHEDRKNMLDKSFNNNNHNANDMYDTENNDNGNNHDSNRNSSNGNNNDTNNDSTEKNNEKRIVDSGPSNLCQYYQVQKMRVVHYQGQTFQYPYVETIKDCYRFK